MKKTIKSIYEAIPLKPVLLMTLKQVWTPHERIYRHLHFRAPFDVNLPGGGRMRVNHYGNQVENDLFWAGFGNGWEATSLLIWLRLAKRAGTIMDIGANTGIYALAARAVNPLADVIALEPVARTFERLRRNIELNSFDIAAMCLAASDRDGTAVIYDPLSEHQYSASLEQGMLNGKSEVSIVEIEVRRADAILANREQNDPVLVKIDAERHERQVLKGFGQRIRELRPAFLIELLDRKIGGDVRNFFEGLNYLYYEIHEGECLRQTDDLGGAQRNYLFCPRETARELKLGAVVEHRSLMGGMHS